MRFLTTGQVAGRWQVTIPTVKRWIREGHLRAFQTAGGHHRITEDEVLRFAAVQGFPSIADLRRILIVDDDASIRELLRDALSDDGRTRIELAGDGYEGLIKVGSFRPHVLLLDVQMPGLNGFEVCRKVKLDPATSATKILAITAYSKGQARQRVFEAGADSFLPKPFQLTELRSEVDRLLSIEAAGSYLPARIVSTMRAI